eukprot:m.62578 g.62578  ORF g.62578 m.62578 type:complete len:884 (+) comp9617_c0_seq3:22-2673(+)
MMCLRRLNGHFPHGNALGWTLVVATVILGVPRAKASCQQDADWLVHQPDTPVTLSATSIGGNDAVVFSNGLISRTFITSPNWATWSLTEGGEELLRAVQPEATFQLDNTTMFSVGGLTGSPTSAFKTPEDPFKPLPDSYQYVSHRTVPIATRYSWVPGTRHSANVPWPPLGLGLEVTFAPPQDNPLTPPGPCPSNCTVCPAGALCCANPGNKFVRGPDPGEVYPYYGKPCTQQSDCSQCTLDKTCTCTPVKGDGGNMTGCCRANSMKHTAGVNTPNSSDLPTVVITYEMYQGIPAMSKKVSLVAGSVCHTARGLLVEKLAFQESHIGRNNFFDIDWAWYQGNRVSLFTSFSRGPQYPCQTGRDGWVAGCSGGAGVFGLIRDPQYVTSYQYEWQSLLVAGFPIDESCAVARPCIEQTFAEFCLKWGPCPPGAAYQWEQELCPANLSEDLHLAPPTFDSMTVFELYHRDGASTEDRGLATRRLHALLAPQVTENPVYMHCTKSDMASLRTCVDQAATVGFEMVIVSFGAGFNLESTDPVYLSQMRNISDYARSKGVEMGGYDLLAHTRGRGHDPNTECISPTNGKPDGSTCLASQGSDTILSNILNFVNTTNWGSVETDGPYEGEACASTTHSHHNNLADSVYTNWKRNMDFYHRLVATGVYINAPDPYFLDGTHKDGMGYDEEQWGRPRWEWIAQARQQIYDETFHKIASMGWMFCPIESYNGGADSIIEPIAQHLPEYEYILATYLGTGTQAAYRGTRLYDPAVPESQAMVKKWVSWFKQYRQILNCDIIHVRRPDMNGIDAMLHVNSNSTRAAERGMLMVWNQTPNNQNTTLKLPLYYTGLDSTANVSFEGGKIAQYGVARDYSIEVNVSMKPMSVTWAIIT